MATRRDLGSGCIYFRNDGFWAGRIQLPSERGSRKTKQVTSKMFCAMLKKFSALEQQPRPEIRGRRENLALARQLGTHTRGEWYAKLRSQKGLCYYCGKKGFRKVELLDGWRFMPGLVMDHMTPVARGGSDAIDNIVGACEPCNQVKATMTADEYMAYLNAR
jgi:5-methylcytosine-specific restriction endonuclease McrA